MKIAFITRSTLHTVPGGDTVQVTQLARQLAALGATPTLCGAGDAIRYEDFDLLHFFNITRPADLLVHAIRSPRPFVISPVLVDYSEYDRHHRKGLSGQLLRLFSPDGGEYIKTIGRRMAGKDRLVSASYLWRGQRRSIRYILDKAAWVLPNSATEQKALTNQYSGEKPFTIIPNGIDPQLFRRNPQVQREKNLVICVARIEGIKNQLNLVKALNDTPYRLVLIGQAAPSQQGYFNACRKAAAPNIEFAGHLPQEQLLTYYERAAVHVLPSWFETCGLSSLEAAAMGCNVVVTGKGYTRDYFADDAFYCDASSPDSIRSAIEKAAEAESNGQLKERIRNNFTWEKAAALTIEAYKKALAT